MDFDSCCMTATFLVGFLIDELIIRSRCNCVKTAILARERFNCERLTK